MLNKDKVNEIVADMQEEERKEKLRKEGIADKFLENRLEYYVAMVINKDIRYYAELSNALVKDINIDNEDKHYIHNRVVQKILESLTEFNIYIFPPNQFQDDFILREKSENDTWLDIFEGMYQENSVINEHVEYEAKQKQEEYEKEKIERQKKVDEEKSIKEKKEIREAIFILVGIIFMFIVAIYIFLTK